jgi:hypothetical protein
LCALAWATALVVVGQACSQAQSALSTQAHGATIVDITQDGRELKISFELSGLDAVGFEHAPRSSADADKVGVALNILQSPDDWILPNADAQCHRTFIGLTPNIFQTLDEHEGHTDAKRGKRRSESAHANIGVQYAFECDTPLRLRSLTFNLIERFPSLRAIIVNLSVPSGQSQTVITASRVQITLTADDD